MANLEGFREGKGLSCNYFVFMGNSKINNSKPFCREAWWPSGRVLTPE